MYLVGWLYFSTLEMSPFVWKVLWVPAAHSLLGTRASCSRGAFYVGCVDPSIVVADYCGQSGRHSWTLVQWAARPSLVWRLLTAGWWAGSQGSQLLNPRLGQGAAPGVVLARWWVGLDHGAAGWRVQGISAPVLACWWVGPRPRGLGLQGPGGPETGISLLISSGARSQDHWLRVPLAVLASW